MRRQFLCALVMILAVGFAAAQRPGQPTSAPATTTPAQTAGAAPSAEAAPEIYKAGGHISPPVLIHSVNAEFTDAARYAHYQGICLIELIVDAQGNPQNVHIVRPLGMGLDENAVAAIRQYKFKPAMKDGITPVPVLITIEVNFKLYNGPTPDPSAPILSSAPGSAANGNVQPPFVLHYVAPKYSKNARKNRISGECVIGLTVDTNGKPQNVHVVTSLEPSLDANAIKAVKQWNYMPATNMRNGNAIPSEVIVKIEFKLPG